MLPNFLCIGAQKSGTTTLLRQLERHPDVFMSPAKETKFFLLDNLYAQGLGSYELEYFSDWNGQKAVGEKTPEYLCDPEVPGRIHATLGAKVKLVASFRSPAQRAYAHYRHNFQHLWETAAFVEALALEDTRSAAGRYQRSCYGYLWRGRYAEQLARYLALFPKNGLFFIVYEQDIVANQMQTLAALFGFLGVDPAIKPAGDISVGRAKPLMPQFIQGDHEVDLGGVKRKAQAGDILFTREGIKPKLVGQPSASLQERARAALEHLPQDTALSRDQELEINRKHFRDDILRLQDLIGRSLDGWLA